MITVWLVCVFFFKQRTAYELRISDWSSDVCSSDLAPRLGHLVADRHRRVQRAHRVLEHGADRAAAGAAECTPPRTDEIDAVEQIGRASCRERVCQYV